MERENIRRKRSIVILLTAAALFFWYLPQIRQSLEIRKEQKEAVEQYVREEKEEKEENEKNEEEQKQYPGGMDQNLVRTVDFAHLRSENKEICAWLWIPGCDLDVPVVRGQDDAYYLTHNPFGEERIYGSIFAPCDTPEEFSEQHTILYGHNMRDGTMFGGLKKYRDAAFEEAYPCLYLYLPGEAWRCRIFSVEETEAESDVYRTGSWKETDWDAWTQERKENSLITCEGAAKKIRKVLTLSTCIGDGSSQQRLTVHAAVEEIFETATGRKEGSVLE